MAGSLLTAMVAFGAVGSGGSPEGTEHSEGTAKRLDVAFPTTNPVSHISYVVNEDTRLPRQHTTNKAPPSHYSLTLGEISELNIGKRNT